MQIRKIERKKISEKNAFWLPTGILIKNVTGWFMDAFTSLKPTEEELSDLQDELLAGLVSSQSKAVNTILSHLKKKLWELQNLRMRNFQIIFRIY